MIYIRFALRQNRSLCDAKRQLPVRIIYVHYNTYTNQRSIDPHGTHDKCTIQFQKHHCRYNRTPAHIIGNGGHCRLVSGVCRRCTLYVCRSIEPTTPVTRPDTLRPTEWKHADHSSRPTLIRLVLRCYGRKRTNNNKPSNRCTPME